MAKDLPNIVIHQETGVFLVRQSTLDAVLTEMMRFANTKYSYVSFNKSLLKKPINHWAFFPWCVGNPSTVHTLHVRLGHLITCSPQVFHCIKLSVKSPATSQFSSGCITWAGLDGTDTWMGEPNRK